MEKERVLVLRSKNEVERAVAVICGLQLDSEHPFEIAIRKHKAKRTIQQNRRYHKVCSEIAEQLVLNGKAYDPDSWKEYFKQLFIGSIEIELPNGSCIKQGISTTTLNIGEFAKFMTQIDAWATDNGVIFEETRWILDQYADASRIHIKREKNRKKKGVINDVG